MWGAVVLMGEMSEIGELDAAFVTLTWVNERVQEAEVEREKGGRESARARERERERARERERERFIGTKRQQEPLALQSDSQRT